MGFGWGTGRGGEGGGKDLEAFRFRAQGGRED